MDPQDRRYARALLVMEEGREDGEGVLAVFPYLQREEWVSAVWCLCYQVRVYRVCDVAMHALRSYEASSRQDKAHGPLRIAAMPVHC